MGAPSKSTLISQGGSGFFSENSDSVLTRHDQNSAREKPAYTDTQKQVDTMVSNFVAQATEWHSLAAMMAGGLAYRYGKIAILGVGGEWAGTSSLANAFLRGASVAGGLGLEVLTFETVHRGLLTLSGHGGENPNMWSWNGQGGWKQGLASSYVNFGILKGAGALCNGQNIVVQHFFQDTAMVAGNNLTALLNLTPKPEGSLAEQLLHAEATNLQLAAGMGLVHMAAPGVTAWERVLDLTVEAKGKLEAAERSKNFNPLLPQLALALAEARGMEAPEPSLVRNSKKDHNVYMSQMEEGAASSGGAEPSPLASGTGGGTPPPVSPGSPGTGPAPAVPEVPPAPQFYFEPEIDAATLKKLMAVPKEVTEKHEGSGDPDPVFFGPNHLLWLKAIIGREGNEMGPAAILMGGKILFGRFQKDPRAQREVERQLQQIAKGAKVKFNLIEPDAETWWNGVWDRALADPAAPNEVLAAILQRVRGEKSGEELSESWLHDLAEKDFDRSEEVRVMVEGPEIVFPMAGRTAFQDRVEELSQMAVEKKWGSVNKALAELFPQAWAPKMLYEVVARLSALRDGVREDRDPVTLRKVQPAKLWSNQLSQTQFEILKRVNKELAEASRLPIPQQIARVLNLLGVYTVMGAETAQIKAKLQSVEEFLNPNVVKMVSQKVDFLAQHKNNNLYDVELKDAYWGKQILEMAERGEWEEIFKAVDQMQEEAPSGPNAVTKDKVLAHLATYLKRKKAKEAEPISLDPSVIAASSSVSPSEILQVQGKALQWVLSLMQEPTLRPGPSGSLSMAYLGYVALKMGNAQMAKECFDKASPDMRNTIMLDQNLMFLLPQLHAGQLSIDVNAQSPHVKRVADFLQDGKYHQALQFIEALGRRADSLQNLQEKGEVLKSQVTALALFAKTFSEDPNRGSDWARVSSPSVREGSLGPMNPERTNQLKAQLQSYLSRMVEVRFLPGGADGAAGNAYLGFIAKLLGHSEYEQYYFQKAESDANGMTTLARVPNAHLALLESLRLGRLPETGDPTIQQKISQGRAGNWEAVFEWVNSIQEASSKAEALAHVAQAIFNEISLPYFTVGTDEVLNIGREPALNHVAIADDWVSGKHARLWYQIVDGKKVLVIQDVGSRNGTFVLDRAGGSEPRRLPPGQHHFLKPGDLIQVGRVKILNQVFRETVEDGDQIYMVKAEADNLWIIKSKSKEVPVESIQLDSYESLPKRDVNTIPEEYRHFIPKPSKKVLFPRMKRILDEVAFLVKGAERIAVRLFGPPGTAKTTIPELIAAAMGVPLLRFTFSKRTDPADMEGYWTKELINGKLETVYKEGVPTIAMEHGFHLVLDEPDLARVGTLAATNNFTAPGEYVWVRKQNGDLTRIKVHEGYRCYATENGVQQIGRNAHGQDFLRRFVPYYVGTWTKPEVTQVLTELYETAGGVRRWSHKTSETLSILHEKMMIMAQGLEDPETRQTMPPLGNGVGQEIEFTPRSVLRLAQRLIASGPLSPESLSRAIRAEYILPLADSNDRDLVWSQVRAIFAPLVREMGWAPDCLGDHAIPAPTLESISQKYLGGKKITPSKFVWTDQALKLTDEILWNRSLGIDVLLLGGAGEGKTKLPPEIARILGLPYYDKVMSHMTDEEDLVGGYDRTGFKPGMLTLAVKNGGIFHPDEYLLADPGKIEGTINPLMDDAKALFIKNPFERIERDPNTFVLATSNPPFGSFEDRNQQSGAAMSRMATIFLADDFAMGEDDLLKILQAPARHQARDLSPGGVKKKGLSDPSSEPKPPPLPPVRPGGDEVVDLTDDPDIQIIDNPVQPLVIVDPLDPLQRQLAHRALKVIDVFGEDGSPKKVLDIPVHAEVRSKFKIPAELVADPLTQTFYEKEENSDGVTLKPISAATKKAILDFASRVTRQTQVEMGAMTGRVFKVGYRFQGADMTDLVSKTIQLNLPKLLEYPFKASLGVGKHEYSHALIDRPHAKYDAHEPGRLLANVVGDPRMNEYYASLREDFRLQLDAMSEVTYKRDWPEEEQKLFQQLLPHEQFADAVIHYWRFGRIMPWIIDEKVKEALEKSLPVLEPAFTLFPKTLEDADVDAAAAEFYQKIDQIWPIYESLLPEGQKQIMKRLENGESPEQIVFDLFQKLQQMFGMPPHPMASPPLPLSSKSEKGQKGPQGPGAPQPGSAGDGEKAESEAPTDRQSQQGQPQAGQPQGAGQPGQGSPASGEGTPRPSQADLEALAKQIMDKRAEMMADRFEPQDPAKFAERKGEIAKAKGEAPASEAPQDGQPADADPTTGNPLDSRELDEINAAQQKVVKEALQNDLYRRMVPQEAIQAARRIRRFLPPGDPSYDDGFFTTGRRMDRKAANRDDMKPEPDGKVMLRPIGVEDKAANIVILSDVSSSMYGAKDNTLRGSATAIFLSEQLKINYGEILFAGGVKVAKPLGKPLNSYQRKNEVLNKKSQVMDQVGGNALYWMHPASPAVSDPNDVPLGDGTNIRDPLDLALKWLKAKKGEGNYILLITDGSENVRNNPKTLEQLQEEAEKMGVHLMVLAMGAAQYSVPRIFKNYRIAKPDGSDIPEKIVELFEDAQKKRLVK
ncbi:MAG: AAA family ATPase [bacterium]